MKKAALWVFVLSMVFWQNCAIARETVQIALPRLPSEFDGFRVAELADLHGRSFGGGNAALVGEVAAGKPDIICLDGDIIDEKTDLSMLEPLLTALTAIAPTFYVTGNHEWRVPSVEKILAGMEALGVRVLRNEFVLLRRGSAVLVVAGVDDPCAPAGVTPEALVGRIRSEIGEDACILMLAHRNEALADWAALGVDLVLAGHCHGGMVRLPVVGGLFGTRRQLFPRFDAGLYRQGETALYVSRGLGYSGVRFRLFNRPHLPILVLKCNDS